MTARDRWTVDLKCPICGRTGKAELSQADGWSFMKDQSTSVDSLSDGFVEREQDGRPAFFCGKDDVRC